MTFRATPNGFRRGHRLSKAGGSLTPPNPLARWLSGNSVSGKKIALWGDSTTANATTIYDRINNELALPGGAWEGCTVVNLGSSGRTLADALINYWTPVLTEAPNLLICCWGINDVRLGATNLATMTSLYATMLTKIRTELPGTDIILWTPNSFLTTDPTSSGYVNPLASAQAYTDILWNACNNTPAPGTWTYLTKFDKQTTTFGRVCQPTSALMSDVIHPSPNGYLESLKPLVAPLTPTKSAINLTASAAAWASNPNDPWTVYSRALEDTRYAVKMQDVTIEYIDLGAQIMIYLTAAFAQPTGILATDFIPGRFIWLPNGVYTIEAGTGTGQDSPSSIRIYSITKTAFPPPPVMNGKLYRKLP